jgi:hypothetical protein
MRFIPLVAQTDSSAPRDDDSGIVRKVDLPLTRREFLSGSGLLFGTLTAGTLLASMAPSNAWALELKSLDTAQGETLMAMGRVLYPHKKLPDAVYALLVKDLDGKAAGSADSAKLLADGIAWLDQSAGGSFLKATPKRRLEAVRAMEGTPFFNTVRGQCVTSLYDNPMAFAVLGYPGSAWEHGGYILRGFQDLKWLAAPPADASPAPFF